MKSKEIRYSRHAPLLGALMFFVPVTALTTAMLIAFIKEGFPVVFWVFALVGCVTLGTTARYNMRWRQYHWFYRSFRDYERFRAQNIDEARRVWHDSGDRGVVRHLKFVYPLLPKEHRLRLVGELRSS